MRVQLCGNVCGNDIAQIYRYFGYTVCCPGDIRAAIETCRSGEELVLEINSGGGSVYAGFEMYSLLRAFKGRAVAEIQSLAASAMSVITCACDTVRISPVGEFMIHRAATIADGNSQEIKQAAQMLDTIDESMLSAYVDKSGGKCDRETFARMMRRETFLTAQQAIEYGLADELLTAGRESGGEAGGETGGESSLSDLLPGLAVAWAGEGEKPDLFRLLSARQLPPVEDLRRLREERENHTTQGGSTPMDEKRAERAEERKPVTPEQLAAAEQALLGNSTPSAPVAGITTLDQLTETYPDLVNQIRTTAAEQAAAAERKRIAEIDAAAIPGYESLIAAAKATPSKRAGDVALEIIKAQKQAGGAYLANRNADAAASHVNDVSAAVSPGAGEQDAAEGRGADVEAAAREAVAFMRKQRGGES